MSSSAWSFAFELIQPGKKPEVQFFGASTLAVKVARFWHEVPDDQYQELRNRILQLMMAYRYSLPKLCFLKVPNFYTPLLAELGFVLHAIWRMSK